MRKLRTGLAGVAVSMFACTVFATAASGADASMEEFKARVGYQDLDIHKPAGAKALYDRIRHVSAEACHLDAYSASRSLTQLRHAKVCYQDLVGRFVARIDSEELQKLHES